MKVGIVGAGMVGATAAYAMVMEGVGREIVLVDRNQVRADAEADDLQHAVPFAHPMIVRAGQYGDLAGAAVVILAAGVGQRPGEDRLAGLVRNAEVFEDIVPQVFAAAPEAVLLVATNPVDVLTHLTARIVSRLGALRGRVIGSGTILDTARFKALLGQHIGVDGEHVQAHVLGEHGDSQVLAWSMVTVGGLPLEQFCGRRGIAISDAVRADIDQRVRRAGYHIISGKGATYYGIGSALARIVEVVSSDHRELLTVCTPLPEVAEVRDVTLSVPTLLGGAGVIATLDMPLAANELEALKASAQRVREYIDALPGTGG